MIFLVQFGINKHLYIFQRPQIARARRASAILLVFEKIYSCLFIPNCTRNHVITYTYCLQNAQNAFSDNLVFKISLGSMPPRFTTGLRFWRVFGPSPRWIAPSPSPENLPTGLRLFCVREPLDI